MTPPVKINTTIGPAGAYTGRARSARPVFYLYRYTIAIRMTPMSTSIR